jgi:farnesyl diphosphate synthase
MKDQKCLIERYHKIVKYETAFYTFYLPVAIGMITSRVAGEEELALAETICWQMGEYFRKGGD